MKLTISGTTIQSNNKLLRQHWAARRRLQRGVAWELFAAYGKPFPKTARKVKMNDYPFLILYIIHDLQTVQYP